jgi:hypothetical protein
MLARINAAKASAWMQAAQITTFGMTSMISAQHVTTHRTAVPARGRGLRCSRSATAGPIRSCRWRTSWTLASVRTTATFRLFGDATLTAEAVTRRLGILPSRAFEVGDRISGRSQATRGSSAWLLTSSPGIDDGTELAGHLHRLLDDLEPVTAQLWDLVHPPSSNQQHNKLTADAAATGGSALPSFYACQKAVAGRTRPRRRVSPG